MKKTPARKLSLASETVRNLSTRDLAGVAGGDPWTTIVIAPQNPKDFTATTKPAQVWTTIVI